jgi:hypothetical protein
VNCFDTASDSTLSKIDFPVHRHGLEPIELVAPEGERHRLPEDRLIGRDVSNLPADIADRQDESDLGGADQKIGQGRLFLKPDVHALATQGLHDFHIGLLSRWPVQIGLGLLVPGEGLARLLDHRPFEEQAADFEEPARREVVLLLEPFQVFLWRPGHVVHAFAERG